MREIRDMQDKPLSRDKVEPLTAMDEIRKLLVDCGLPVSDIFSSHPARFFGIHRGSTLIAMVGIETYGPTGLLRSLAVTPSCRGFGLARQLVAYIEQMALSEVSEDVASLYLLTTTASGYFEKLGFAPVSRSDAPPVIQATTQFAGLCPSSSALLCKSLK